MHMVLDFFVIVFLTAFLILIVEGTYCQTKAFPFAKVPTAEFNQLSYAAPFSYQGETAALENRINPRDAELARRCFLDTSNRRKKVCKCSELS